MSEHKNFLRRAFEAVIAGREREAQRYVDRYQRDFGPKLKRGLTKE